MADTTETVVPEQPNTEAQAAVVEAGKDGEKFDAARAQALIDKLRAENKAAKAAERELIEIKANEMKRKEAEMSDLEKANKKAAELETKLKETETRERRARIGGEYKLPAEIAELLQGDDDETMKAQAAKIAAALPKSANLGPTNFPAGPASVTDAQRRAYLYGGAPLP
jgi:hypothetical protein